MRVMQKWHNHDFFGVTTWMSTIKNIDTIGIAGIMNNPLDSVTRTSALKDIVKPFDDSLIDSVARIGSVKYNNDEVNHSPCYTVTYSLHSVNSVKLYIYFSSSTWSLLCACFFTPIFSLALWTLTQERLKPVQ